MLHRRGRPGNADPQLRHGFLTVRTVVDD